jgi:hypothetical protein
MKFFKKSSKVQNDNWMFWDFYDEDDYYGLTFLDSTYIDPKIQKGFKKEYYLKIIIPDSKLIQRKFPNQETNQELLKLEDMLITELVF